jgi:hypothetical protein
MLVTFVYLVSSLRGRGAMHSLPVGLHGVVNDAFGHLFLCFCYVRLGLVASSYNTRLHILLFYVYIWEPQAGFRASNRYCSCSPYLLSLGTVRARGITSPADLRQIRVGKKEKYPGFLLRGTKENLFPFSR